MKTAVSTLALAALSAVPPLVANTHVDQYRPVGSLEVSQTVAASGERPEITWNIAYPTTVEDLLIPETSGRVTTKERVNLTLRVAGAAFQDGITELPVALWTSIDAGAWQQLYYGDSSQVQPQESIITQEIPANSTIDFAARGRKADGSWYDVRWTVSDDMAVTGLTNGESPSTNLGTLQSYLTGYFSNNGHGNNLDGVDSSNPGESMDGLDADPTSDDEVKALLGPREMIYLFELASRDATDLEFDLQDLAVIATYESTNSTP